MNPGLVQFHMDAPGFSEQIADFAAVAGMHIRDAGAYQAGLLCGEIMKRTPPLSGKSLKKMVEAHQSSAALKRADGAMGPFKPAGLNEPEIESMTARAIGARRVEKDIRRVIYGLEGAQLSARHMEVSRGNSPNATDWGTLQKCEGKQAVRVFATKSGEVFGADLSEWFPDATREQMAQHHEAQRTKRGRVTTAGQKTRNVGRWRWLNVMVVKEEALARFIKWRQGHVGEAKGGWAAAFMRLGGRISRRGWVGKHSSSGSVKDNLDTPEARKGNYRILMANESRWASAGDPDRIIEQSIAGRGKAIAGDIRRRLEASWGSKARRAAQAKVRTA